LAGPRILPRAEVPKPYVACPVDSGEQATVSAEDETIEPFVMTIEASHRARKDGKRNAPDPDFLVRAIGPQTPSIWTHHDTRDRRGMTCKGEDLVTKLGFPDL